MFWNKKLETLPREKLKELQLKRLEQLTRKGLVEKKRDVYIVKDKQKFKEYINSQKADKDRERIAKSKITNKIIKSKVNSFINRHSKIRPVKDFKSSYYHFSKAFGKSTGDRVVAFAVAVGYSIGKTSIKLAIRTAISVIRFFIKTTNKTIQYSQNKNFEKRINQKYQNKNKINNKLKNKKNKEFDGKFINQISFSEKKDKFSEEIEKNKKFDYQSIDNLLKNKDIETSHSLSQ